MAQNWTFTERQNNIVISSLHEQIQIKTVTFTFSAIVFDHCFTVQGANQRQQSQSVTNQRPTSRASPLQQLNLNSLCKSPEWKQGECYVDEIVLPSESLQSLSELKVLSLRNNDIHNFPVSVLQLTTLVTLDVSDNCLLTLPPEIRQLIK